MLTESAVLILAVPGSLQYKDFCLFTKNTEVSGQQL